MFNPEMQLLERYDPLEAKMNIGFLCPNGATRKRLARNQRKVLLVCLGFLVFSTFLCIQPWPMFMMKIYYWANPEKGIACYAITGRDKSLPDISDMHPQRGKSIFFHETSCNSYFHGKTVITARQACAVESAARMNPNREVYLLYVSPGRFMNQNTESDRVLSALMTYSNVRILNVDLERYLSGTPLEKLWTSGKMRYSQYSQPHASDVLRYLTLWKYGGIYLDLDVIVIKPLDHLGSNYAGYESDGSVAAGIINFDDSPSGRQLSNMTVQDLANNFRGDDWGWNGPGTITRYPISGHFPLFSAPLKYKLEDTNPMVYFATAPSIVSYDVKFINERLFRNLQNNCKLNLSEEPHRCQNFTVYPERVFYAVPWKQYKLFCQTEYLDKVLNMSRESYIIHVWNKFSSSCQIPLDSNVPYLYFAKKYCPKVVEELNEYF